MIQIVYHRKYHRVSIEGHAHSGEPGHDLVCASVSSLAYTLGVAVVNMSTAYRREIREPKTEFSPGKALISCNPANRYKSTITLIFDTICAGFEYLAQNNPEYIHYEIRG